MAEKKTQRQRIEQAAYYRAQRRGFAPGREAEDWLAAEREVIEQDARDAPAAPAPSDAPQKQPPEKGVKSPSKSPGKLAKAPVAEPARKPTRSRAKKPPV